MKIVLFDDHALFSESLKMTLERFDEIKKVHIVKNSSNLYKLLNTGEYNIALLDIHIKNINGLEIGRQVKSDFPKILVVFLTGFSLGEYKNRAIEIGADGFFSKNISPKLLLDNLKSLSSGLSERLIDYSSDENILTNKEKEVLLYVSQGYSHNDIAKVTKKSKRTVETQLQNIYTKLNVNNATTAVIEGIKLGYVQILEE